jgi:hypothetical protein
MLFRRRQPNMLHKLTEVITHRNSPHSPAAHSASGSASQDAPPAPSRYMPATRYIRACSCTTPSYENPRFMKNPTVDT